MNIRTIKKKSLADKTIFQYDVVLEDGQNIKVNFYRFKGEVFIESDILSIPQLRALFEKMMKSKHFTDRLRLLMMNPKNFIYMPPDPFDFSGMFTWEN
jgi:hypothetical protein